MKRTTRLIGIVAIAMVLSIAFSGVASASCPVNETEQNTRIATITEVTCMGTVIEDESFTFEQASVDLMALPPLAATEMYGNTRYSESMIARDGYTSYVKDFDVDTGNTEGRPNYNLEVEKTFDYLANNGGGLIFSESVAIDSISLFDGAPDLMCPFAAGAPGAIPDSCEYVEAGSTLDVTEVHTTTHARTITTAMACDITPVILHYDIRAGATDLTTTPLAVGSASAFMTVHDMVGRADGALGSEVEYWETVSVSGLFDLYKDMNYESGLILP